MDHTVAVRVRQRIGDLNAVAQHRFDLKPCLGNQFVERLPLHVLHHDMRLTIARADFIDRADVRMVQLRRMLRLDLQRRLRVRIVAGHHLQRHGAAQLHIARGIHFAHAAHADQPDHFVVASDLPARQTSSRRTCRTRLRTFHTPRTSRTPRTSNRRLFDLCLKRPAVSAISLFTGRITSPSRRSAVRACSSWRMPA